MKQVIPVFFTFDHNYVLPAKVAIYSLLCNASKQYFYELNVLHTQLDGRDMAGLRSIAGKFDNARIDFIDVSSFDDDASILHGKKHFSKEIYYKLIAADIFPDYPKIICSDVDVVFPGDISETFFAHDGESYYYAGVGQVFDGDRMDLYESDFSDAEKDALKHEISGGYVVFNLDEIRKGNVQRDMQQFYKQNYGRLVYPEQDCMIMCCWPKIAYLPIKSMVLNSYYALDVAKETFFKYNEGLSAKREDNLRMFREALAHPVQLHFVGAEKPWNNPFVNKSRVWFGYLVRSGCAFEYICLLPHIILKKLSNYSLRRFLKKVARRLKRA